MATSGFPPTRTSEDRAPPPAAQRFRPCSAPTSLDAQPDPLGRTDFVDHWAGEARHHADAIAVPAERISQVVEVLEDTFGADWLRGRSKAPSRSSLTRDPKKHPVAHLIASPHRSSVMQLIELAVYLRNHMTGTSAHGPRLGGLLLLGPDGGHLEALYEALAFRESRRRLLDDWADRPTSPPRMRSATVVIDGGKGRPGR